MKTRTTYFTLMFLLAGSFVFSQRVMSDLEGSRGRDAETQLSQRGYAHVKTDKQGYDIYSFWWNPREKNCVCARINDGKVKSVVKSMPFDCNKNEDGSALNHNRMTHSSVTHYPSGKNYSSQLERQAFERGFRDANHNVGYENVYKNSGSSASVAYNEGYEAGRKARNQATTYHSNNSHDSSKEYWDWHHLVGAQHVSAHNELLKNGWKEVHAYNLNNRRHKIYYRESNGQCIEVIHDTEEVVAIHHNDNCKSWN
jgi:hypothetical protein